MVRLRRYRWWFVALFAAVCAGMRADAIARDLHTPRDLQRVSYVGSDACRSCHPQHHASWHRTFHRTMTQDASVESIVGDFNNATLDYGGVRTRMTRDQGGHVMEFSADAGRTRWKANIERTVGSHRIQQYLARDGDVYFRLPVAWDVEAERWIHMNGAFLTPDPTLNAAGTRVERADFDRHVTRWNDNCVFCHNVAPNPGLHDNGHFETTTAELGIACEACHGPGDEHARVNRDPLRRYALHLSDATDPTIANPANMTAARSGAVCGRCHGQRKAKDIDAVMRDGDTFVPGTDLAAHSTPLQRDTTLNGAHGTFANRFWNDGTPRLTAYEYQGLLQSPCAVRGELSCGSCHSMHDSDPDMQLRRDLAGAAGTGGFQTRPHNRDLAGAPRTGGFQTRPYKIHDNSMCTQCHTTLTSDQASSAHSHHVASSPGSRCVACHMPSVVYGVIGARISHRIENVRPLRNVSDRRPDPCTLCHVMRPTGWLFDGLTATKYSGRDQPDRVVPRMALLLFAGDPIERAIAAAALGRDQDPEDSLAQRETWLLNTLTHDRYPAVRKIARDSLVTLVTPHDREVATALGAFNLLELSPTTRAQQLAPIAARLPRPRSRPPRSLTQDDRPLSDSEIAELRSGAAQHEIEIGE